MDNQLKFEPAINRPDLLPENSYQLLKNWSNNSPVETILITPINPDYADSDKFCKEYNVDPASGANCVIVEAVRGTERSFAACLVPVNCRADLNKTARKTLGVRRVSFAPLEQVIEETGMEYGGITPFGLPDNYPILIDSKITDMDKLIIGGGLRKSKLSIPISALLEVPNVQIVEGLGVEIK